MKNIFKKRETGIVLLLIAIIAIISIKNITFLRIDNVLDILKMNTAYGILALGMLPVILTGGIDVSVSGAISIASVVIGVSLKNYHLSIPVVFLLGLIFGILTGVINGLLVAKLKLPAIVATLGTMSIYNGAVLLYTNGLIINGLPAYFTSFGRFALIDAKTSFGTVGIAIQLFFFIAAALLTWFVLRFTLIGRGIYALGGNRVSAERIGYNSDKVNLFLYSFMGLMVGIAAFVHTSIAAQVDTTSFTGIEMTVIGCVVIGGANIMGGEGTVFGTILGVLFFAVINNGMNLMHVSSFLQKIVAGAIILIVVSIDSIQRQRQERNLVKVDLE